MIHTQFFWLAEETFNRVDKLSMANSIEVRSPFLDKNKIDSLNNFHPNSRIQIALSMYKIESRMPIRSKYRLENSKSVPRAGLLYFRPWSKIA